MEAPMLEKKNPLKTRAWREVKAHVTLMKKRQMKDLFAEDSERFSTYSLRFEDILFDYSKNIITGETMRLLYGLADQAGVAPAAEKMFSGERINETENRAALHIALRNRSNSPIYLDGRDVMPEVNTV